MLPRSRTSQLIIFAALVALAALGAVPLPERPAPLPPATPMAAVVPAAAMTPTPLPATVKPPATARPTLLPTTSPTPRPTPQPTADPGVVIGRSVEGRPVVAYRIGNGPIKVVLVGDIHGDWEANTYTLARRLLAYFQAHRERVPDNVSLWIVPTANPDGLHAGKRTNARDVDLNRNADTNLDGCAGNDWSPDASGPDGKQPGSGGAYPFSEPEARALKSFLADASIAVFYHSAAEAIFVDTCGLHAPTARLAAVLSEGTGYPVPAEGWTGYHITGEFADYLAGEGVAAVTVELADHQDPEFERNLAGVEALLPAAEQVLQAEAADAGADYVWLAAGRGGNTGAWHYAPGTFPHPIALEVLDGTAYVLDGGRVLALDLEEATPPRQILAPGDDVAGVRVLEPLDLTSDRDTLLVLDRAGDVYRYTPTSGEWSMARYDRPVRDIYDHYYVALAGADDGGYLLETTHERVWHFSGDARGAVWAAVPKGRDVDLAAAASGIYVLTRGMNNPLGALARYRGGLALSGFAPGIALFHPRQVHAAGDRVYVLDRAGRRLVDLDAQTGNVRALYQFHDRRAMGAVWAGTFGTTARQEPSLLLAGRDTIYIYGHPEQQASVEGGPASLEGPQPHDPADLDDLRGLLMPIAGASITSRDFQLPGAPRHYRLGVHEGMDFYGHTVGVPVGRDTPVRAVADGVVLRAMIDYEPLTAAQANAWAAEVRRLGYTPPEVLDGYRGRQVWIQHEGGLVSRYAHLGSIAPGIEPGAQVERGQVIAYVGNSGTPDSLRGPGYDVHLHLELWLGDHFVGQFLRPAEAREWIERILR